GNKYALRLAWSLVIIGTTIAISTIFWRYKTTDLLLVLGDNRLAIFRSIIWGLPCAMLLLGCVILEKNNIFSTPNFIKVLGDASYSNYLSHMFIINIITKFGHKLPNLPYAFSADLYIVALVIICTLASVPMYIYVEKPLTKLANRSYNIITSVTKKRAVA
ncbi:MAG TPA: hypothetical protein VF598_09540, partial [Hymenobacter sp.]